MPPARNTLGYNTAKKNGWYCRFDPELNDRITCEPDHADAKVDMIRGLMSLRGGDPGPSTPESVRARHEYNRNHPQNTAP